MTNLQSPTQDETLWLSPATLKRLWFWGPITVGGAIALVVLLAVALPQWLEIQRVQQRVKELEDYQQQVELLRLQAQQTVKDLEVAKRQQKQLIRLVTGKGDPATFLATLDLEAIQAGVKLQLYEPVPELAAAAGAARRPGAAPPPPQPPPPPPPPAGAAGAPAAPGVPGAPGGGPPPDPMRQAGLLERPLMLTATGRYTEILDFLRRMEALDVLVEQKGLTLTVAGSDPGTNSGSNQVPPLNAEVEVSLALTLWTKEPNQEAPVNPPPKGAVPPQAAVPPG
jgi:type IV pilus assembly protein PilO